VAKSQSQLLEILTTQSVAQKVIKSPLSDQGLDDALRFPFLAVVGQEEMKLALMLSIINRQVGGLLLIGPRGTGKTTAVRGLINLLPSVRRSACPYGCQEEAVESFGIDAVCTECAVKIGMGEPITRPEPMRLVELPLNARLEDVVGGINERIALEQNKIVLDRGILSYADQNLLYIDEVNLLDDAITNAILDAAAQGIFTVRRGPMSATYRSRLFLVGSMNPEEGQLRPQLQDRFGLRVVVSALEDPEARLDAYRRAVAYQQNPHQFVAEWQHQTNMALLDIQDSRERLPQVGFEKGVEEIGIRWIKDLQIQSHRAEITLFEAARAYAAADERDKVTLDDLKFIAPMALRQRHSDFINTYVASQEEETGIIQDVINQS
jgi:magnesium chelatase subunit I